MGHHPWGSHSGGVAGAEVSDPDVNDDGIVNILDLSLVGSCFGIVNLATNPQCQVVDTDGDGDVDMDDFNFVVRSFGQSGFPTFVDPICVPGGTCLVGLGECQRTGTEICVNGALVCEAVRATPVAETCDGLDNDCNGVVDDQPAAREDCDSRATIDCNANFCIAGACGFLPDNSQCDEEASEVCTDIGCQPPPLCPCEHLTAFDVSWSHAFDTNSCFSRDQSTNPPPNLLHFIVLSKPSNFTNPQESISLHYAGFVGIPPNSCFVGIITSSGALGETIDGLTSQEMIECERLIRTIALADGITCVP